MLVPRVLVPSGEHPPPSRLHPPSLCPSWWVGALAVMRQGRAHQARMAGQRSPNQLPGLPVAASQPLSHPFVQLVWAVGLVDRASTAL